MADIILTIAVPLLAGLILTLLRAIASQKQIDNDTTPDIALDMIFLAIGAAGGVFHDSKVRNILGSETVTWLLVLILVDLFVAAVLLYRKRFKGPVTLAQAGVNLLLGLLTVFTISGVIYMGTKAQ